MRQAGTHVRRGKRDNDKQNNGKLFPLKKARSEQIKKSSLKAVPEAPFEQWSRRKLVVFSPKNSALTSLHN